MSNLHRISWIDAEVRAGRYPNSRTIARRFEISTRQAARDIEYLKYSMGAPLEYSPQKNGYFYSEEGFALPPHFISGEERRTLGLLAHLYREAGGNQAARLAGLFARLANPEKTSAGDGGLPVFTPGSRAAVAFEALQQAMARGRKVEVTYLLPSNLTVTRAFLPHRVSSRQGRACVAGAWDPGGETACLWLDRVRAVRELDEHYRLPKPVPSTDGTGTWEPYTALVRLPGSPGPGNFSMALEPAGEGLYRIRFFRSEELITQLFRTGPGFSIVWPTWLRQRLRELLEEIHRRHLG
ncbi:MAG: WYL domain-containing protein [Bacillota bacterium]